MDVKNRLTGLLAVVEDKAILLGTLLSGDLIGLADDLAHYLLILRRNAGRPCDVLLGDNKKMDRRLGRYIAKGKNVIIFVQFVRRNITVNDLTEQAGGGQTCPPGE